MTDELNWFFVGLMVYGTLGLSMGAGIQLRLKRRRSAVVLGCAACVLALGAISLRALG